MATPPTSNSDDQQGIETPRLSGRGVIAPASGGYLAATVGALLGAGLGFAGGLLVGFAFGEAGVDVDAQIYAVILSVLAGTWLGSWLGCFVGLRVRRHRWAGQTAAFVAAAGPVWAFFVGTLFNRLDGEAGLALGVLAYALVPLGARAAVVRLHSDSLAAAR